MKINSVIITCGVCGFLFAALGGINSGYSLESCEFYALAGVFFGLVAEPVMSPKDFKYPTLWQISSCVAGFLVVAFILSLPPMGYALAVLLGVIAGYTAPSWVKHFNIL